jgi:hypothetical protein
VEMSDSYYNHQEDDDDDDDQPIAKLIKHKSGKGKEPDEALAQPGFIGSSAAAAAAAQCPSTSELLELWNTDQTAMYKHLY